MARVYAVAALKTSAPTQLALFVDSTEPAVEQPAVPRPTTEDEDLFADFLDELVDVQADEETLSRTARLRDRVNAGAGTDVRVTITDNRHSLLSWRRDDQGGYVIRAHHMFLDAPEDVAVAVGRWMVGPRVDCQDRLIDRFMADHRHLVTRERRPMAHPHGAFHDLAAIYAELNAQEFGGVVQAAIGWGEPGSPRRRRRRTIQLGCYDPDSQAIVVHPALDQHFVPSFFVQSVVFHEMLHQQVPATENGDRRCVHNAEFRRREDAFHLTPMALAWQRANLGRLLAYRQPVASRMDSGHLHRRGSGRRG